MTPLVLIALAMGAPDPDVLTRSVVAADEPCPSRSDHPAFRVERAEAPGRNAAEAIGAARHAAFALLEDKVCRGYEETPRCLAARRAIVPHGPGHFDKKRRSACASVAIEGAVLDSVEADLARLDDAMAGLADAAGKAGTSIAFDVPVWAGSGCPAGEVGAHLVNMVEARLQGVTLAEPGATRVRLKLSSSGGRVQVAAAVKSGPGWTPLAAPDLSFPADLFRIGEGETGTCPDDAAMGLTGGSRPAEGLAVDLLAGGGFVCEGETVEPSLTVSGPARVRLYSVQPDGQGFLVWPSRAEDDLVYDPDRPPVLPPFTAIQTEDGGDSRLVAVAFPGSAPPADFCRLPSPFSAANLPEGAAVDATSFHVAPAGERLCRSRGDSKAAEAHRLRAETAISQAHVCASSY